MMDAIAQAIELRQTEVTQLPQHVQVWMAFMQVLFFSSVLFVVWRVEARFVLAMAVLTGVGLVAGKIVAPQVHSTPVGVWLHLVLWLPVLGYLVANRRRLKGYFGDGGWTGKVYAVWLFVVMTTITISLVLDIREALGWLGTL